MATAAPSALAARAEPRVTNKWLVAIAVACGALLEVVDTSIVNVALNEMQNSLGATLSQVSWVVSSYAVANVIILPMTAWLGDRFGTKRYFIFSLIAFTLASILCGVATNLPMLIFARVLQGLGGGGLMAKAQAILFQTFPREEQAMAQGFFGAIVIAGPAIGPTLGGYLVTNVDWRWIFFVNVPVGIAAVFLCLAFLPEDPERSGSTSRVDWAGIGLLTVGLGSLQTVLEEGQSEDWFSSSFIVVFFVLAVVGLVCFVWRELTAAHPIVDLRVLRYRSLWAGSILSVIVGMALYGTLFSVPIFAQSVLHYTSQQTGMLLLPSALASAFMMPIAAKLLGLFDPRPLLDGGLVHPARGALLADQAEPADRRDRPGHAAHHPLLRHGAHVPAAQHGDPGPRPPERDLQGLRRLQPHPAARRQHRRGPARHPARRPPGLPPRRAGGEAPRLRPGHPGARAHVHRRDDGQGLRPQRRPRQGRGPARRERELQAAVMSFGDTFWATGALIVLTMPLVFLLGKGGGKVEMGH